MEHRTTLSWRLCCCRCCCCYCCPSSTSVAVPPTYDDDDDDNDDADEEIKGGAEEQWVLELNYWNVLLFLFQQRSTISSSRCGWHWRMRTSTKRRWRCCFLKLIRGDNLGDFTLSYIYFGYNSHEIGKDNDSKRGYQVGVTMRFHLSFLQTIFFLPSSWWVISFKFLGRKIFSWDK